MNKFSAFTILVCVSFAMIIGLLFVHGSSVENVIIRVREPDGPKLIQNVDACEPCDNSSPFHYPNFMDKKPEAPPKRTDLISSNNSVNVLDAMVFQKEFIRTEVFTYDTDMYIFTIISLDFVSMWLNLLKSLEPFGLHKNVVVIVTDEETEKAIFDHAYNYVYVDFALPKGGQWGEEDYTRIVQSKYFLLQCIPYLKLYKQMKWISFFDSDMVFVKDPFPHLKEQFEEKSDLDMLWWVGCWTPNCNVQFSINTGGVFFKPKPKIFLFFSQSLFMQKYKYPGCTDQRAINAILRGGDDTVFADTNFASSWRMDDRNNAFHIVWDIMDPFLFPNGKVFYDESYQNTKREQCIGVHYNFLVGIQAKIDKMKSYNNWFIDQ